MTSTPSTTPETDEPEPKTERRTDARLALLLAALASVAAGIIHIAAAPAHWEEWLMSGLFFLGAALFQIVWAILIVRFSNRFFLAIGLLANLGLVAMWAYSRWQGLPVGPHAGVPEAIAVADVVATALEAAIVLGTLWALLPRESHGVLGAAGYRTVSVLAAVVMSIALVPGVSSALSHGEDGHSHGDSEEADDHHDHDHGTEVETEADPEPTDDASEAEPTAEATTPAEEEEDHTHAPGDEHD